MGTRTAWPRTSGPSCGWLVVLSLLLVGCGKVVRPTLSAEDGSVPDSFLLDDFSRDDGASALGTRWTQYTDQVMGGVSTATHRFEELDGRRCIRLQGEVSLENRGGFIQVALPLVEGRGRFDAGQFRGVRLWVRGNGETYHVHLRTTRTWLPWQFFTASFPADGEWRQVDIPFERFKPQMMTLASLNRRKLTRLAVVAMKKAFTADVAVARIELYR